MITPTMWLKEKQSRDSFFFACFYKYFVFKRKYRKKTSNEQKNHIYTNENRKKTTTNQMKEKHIHTNEKQNNNKIQ